MNLTPDVKLVINHHKTLFDTSKYSKLGRGENNVNYKIGDKVLRISLNPDESIIKKEHDMLKKLPRDIGPNPILLDLTKTIISRPYMILTYIPGNHVTKWSKKHFVLHARKLAQLHAKTWKSWGRPGKRRKKLSLVSMFKREFPKWHPPLENEYIKELLPKFQKYIAEHNSLFTSMNYFTIEHFDLWSENILFTENDVNYIDWEWSRIGDPARDVAYLYTKGKSTGWFFHLDDKSEKFFVDEYLKHRKDKTLIERIRVWQVWRDFFELLFCIESAKNNKGRAQSKEFYRKTIPIQVATLRKALENC